MTEDERKRIARKMTNRLIENLSDRRGFGQVWDACDSSVRNDMIDEWTTLIASTLEEVANG